MNARKPKNMLLTAVCAVLLAAGTFPASALAQGELPSRNPSQSGLWWVSAGLGLGHPLTFQGGISLNAGRRLLYQIAYNYSMEVSLSHTRSTVNSVSAGIGHEVVNAGIRVVAFAGPALLWGNGPPENDRRLYSSLGLVLNGQIITGYGLGLDLYGNVNPVMSTAGVRLVFQIGRGYGKR